MNETKRFKRSSFRNAALGYGILIFSVLMLIESAIYRHLYVIELKNVRLDLETTESNKLNLLEEIITQTTAEVLSNLMIIVENPDFRLMLDTGRPEYKKRFAELLISFTKRTLLYDQARYIDEKGNEIIRVNLIDNIPGVVPKELLQYKGDRSYFKRIITLPGGNIYVSPMELNIEKGKIQIPYNPVIRFGAAAFAASGRKGMVVLNVFGDRFIQNSRWGTVSLSSLVHLLNRDGFWLSSPEESEEWGFQVPDRKEKTFSRKYPPGLWEKVSHGETGQMFIGDRFFSYKSLSPIQVEGDIMGAKIDNSSNNEWKLVLEVPADRIALLKREARKKYLLSYLGFAAVILIVSVFWAVSIARRRYAEKRLVESEEEFRLLAENATDMISRHAPDGRLLYVSPICTQILGYNPAALTSANPFDYIHPEDILTLRDSYERMLKGGEVSTIEYRYRRSDGSYSWVETTGRTVKNEEDGSIKQFIAITRDITGRKKAEEALRNSEEKYRGLFESSSDGISFTDLSGNFLDCNQAFSEMIGYSLEELKSMNFQMLTPPQWLEIDKKIVRKEIDGKGNGDEYEKELIGKDGTVLPVSIKGWVIKDEQGDPIGLWGFVRDISQRKRLDAEKIQRERLQGVLEMAGAASHELNQPMQVISGYVELLENRIKFDREFKREMTILKVQIARLTEMTRKLQNITKYETKDYVEGLKIIDIDRASD